MLFQAGNIYNNVEGDSGSVPASAGIILDTVNQMQLFAVSLLSLNSDTIMFSTQNLQFHSFNNDLVFKLLATNLYTNNIHFQGADSVITNGAGGDLFIRAGYGNGSGVDGDIFFGDDDGGTLPAKTTESNVIFYDTTTGKLSYGDAGSGDGAASSLETTNFSILEEDGELVIKYGTTIIASFSSAGLLKTLDDVETFATL